MRDEVGSDVSSGPSFWHDDPVFAKEIQPADESNGPTAKQVQGACHDTLPGPLSS
jgi:hypothetical protein